MVTGDKLLGFDGEHYWGCEFSRHHGRTATMKATVQYKSLAKDDPECRTTPLFHHCLARCGVREWRARDVEIALKTSENAVDLDGAALQRELDIAGTVVDRVSRIEKDHVVTGYCVMGVEQGRLEGDLLRNVGVRCYYHDAMYVVFTDNSPAKIAVVRCTNLYRRKVDQRPQNEYWLVRNADLTSEWRGSDFSMTKYVDAGLIE